MEDKPYVWNEKDDLGFICPICMSFIEGGLYCEECLSKIKSGELKPKR